MAIPAPKNQIFYHREIEVTRNFLAPPSKLMMLLKEV